jgi:thioesterase domain-containing protein
LRRDAFVEVLRRGDVEALFEQLHAEGALPSEVSVAVLRREARVRIGLYEALYRYHPTEAAVSATLLRAEATLHVELNEKSPDPTLGWGALVKDYLAIVEIPGDHESLMQEPRIGRLAEVLASLLGRRRTRGE